MGTGRIDDLLAGHIHSRMSHQPACTSCEDGLDVSVWATVSAFANTSGGAIVMGLDESSGFTPTDGFEPGKVRDQFVDGMGDANTSGARLTHPPSYELHRHVVGEAPVLVAVIAPNAPGSRPCFVTARGLAGGSYKRVDDKDIALSATEVFSMQNELISLGSDREEVPETTPEALDQQMISSLLAVQSRSRALYGAQSDAEKLFRLNITTADGTLRRAGLLACAMYPQKFLPSHIIDVAVHPTTHKSDPGAPRRFVDRRRCDGTILDMVDDAVYTVARNLRTSSVVTGRGRTDHLEIPEIALREVIANAALHRELSPLFDGTPIVVDVFTDRVQVTSPGGLWGGVTLDNIADGISHCRNPTLLQLLLALPVRHQLGSTLTAAVEGQGSGIPLVHRLMADEGLVSPHFEAKPDAFVVTLYRQGHEPGDIPDRG